MWEFGSICDTVAPMRMSIHCSIRAHTSARIWTNLDEEHKVKKPKMPQKIHSQVLAHWFAVALHPNTCTLLTTCCGSAIIGVLSCDCELGCCSRSVQRCHSKLSTAKMNTAPTLRFVRRSNKDMFGYITNQGMSVGVHWVCIHFSTIAQRRRCK